MPGRSAVCHGGSVMSRGVRWTRALQPIHLDRVGDTEAGAVVVGAITPRGGGHHVCGTDSDSLHACAPMLSPTAQGGRPPRPGIVHAWNKYLSPVARRGKSRGTVRRRAARAAHVALVSRN